MKAQQQVLTPILITLILISIVGSVYLWGIPLIQKNRGIANLQRSEEWIKDLNNKIKFVANTEGREQISINIPGTVIFNETEGSISLKMKTHGTIYSVGGRIYFVRNESEEGTLGKDEPELLYAETREIDGKYLTTYTLKYRKLNSPEAGYPSYKINLTGSTGLARQEHDIVIEYGGVISNENLMTTIVKIKIV